MQNSFNRIRLVLIRTLKLTIPRGLPKGIFNYSLCIAFINLINFIFVLLYLVFGYLKLAAVMFILFVLKEFYFLILRKYSFSLSVFYLILIVNMVVSFSIYLFHFKILYAMYLLCLVMSIHSTTKSVLRNRIPHIFLSISFIIFYFVVLFEKSVPSYQQFTLDKLLICLYVFSLLLVVSNSIFISETMNSIKRNYLELELRNINSKLKEANKEAIQFSQTSTSYFKSNLKIFDYHFDKIEKGINSLLPIEEMSSHFVQLQKTLDDEIRYIDNIFLYNQVITHKMEYAEYNLPLLTNSFAKESNFKSMEYKYVGSDSIIYTDKFLFNILFKLLSNMLLIENIVVVNLILNSSNNTYKLVINLKEKNILKTLTLIDFESIMIGVNNINQNNIERFILQKILNRLFGKISKDVITEDELNLILTFELIADSN